MQIIDIKTITEFEKQIANNDLLLLDFWAKWCPPCIKMRSQIEKKNNKLEQSYPNLVMCSIEINKDTQKWILESKKWDLDAIPVLYCYYKQKQSQSLVGLNSLKDIIIFVQKHSGIQASQVKSFFCRK